MIRILSLGLVLFLAPIGSGVATTFSVPLRQLRPFPALLRTLGVAPVPADVTPSDSTAFTTALANAVGGDTITLAAGTT